MTADDLARQVAKDLAPQFGSDIPAKTEAVLTGEQSRGWGQPQDWEFALTISGLVVHAAGLAWDFYKETRDLPRIKEMLTAKLERPKSVSEHDAAMVIDSVVGHLKQAES